MAKIYVDIPATPPERVVVEVSGTADGARTEAFNDLYASVPQAAGKLVIDDAQILTTLWSFVYFEAGGLRSDPLILAPQGSGGATILAAELVERAGVILSDEGATHWTKSSLLADLGDGQLELARRKPGVSARVTVLSLGPGPNQMLPAGALRLIRPIRNLGADGATPGRQVDLAPPGTMDRLYPQWYATAGPGEVRLLMYNPELPTLYQVYPPQPSSNPHKIEAEVSHAPALCTIEGVDGATASTVLSVADDWFDALLAFVIGRAHSRETEEASSAKAAAWMGRFDAATGGA